MNISINLDSCIEYILSIFTYLVWGLFYYIDMLILYYKVISLGVNIKIKVGFIC
jgi:hypothetical protein